jgi:hypothetical protein
MVREQDVGDARVFGCNQVNPGEHVERAQRDVAQVSERRGDDI